MTSITKERRWEPAVWERSYHKVLELGEALKNNEFMLVYQPKHNLAKNRFTGVEALLRWPRRRQGQVPIDKVIDLAERSGMIVPIGEWVIRTALKQVKLWQDNGLTIDISINVSPRQLMEEGFAAMIADVAKVTGVDPSRVEFEITERIASDPEQLLAVIGEVRAMGFRFSLDDFGTGYNSLAYLGSIPVDTLKIDQRFTRECTSSIPKAAIIKSIIQLAKSLRLQVVAEGVETKDQLQFMQEHDCQVLQGYLFSKPISAAAIETLMANQKMEQTEPEAPPSCIHCHAVLIDDRTHNEQVCHACVRKLLLGK
ncbi:putative bifunctional diguanylate cyclase/phosphodiesterase [Paenibacillus xanthanilyticus]|uniref:Bifunctional diguanylate cyclase/phosphodiesterase n=1 Tax=Paenibacillus xanthanilyticus TaxID=1783531 RepID=A0ABV8K6I5_9BACL